MSRPKLVVSEVEEQLMEATAELIRAIEDQDLRPVAKAVKTIRFATLVNRGQAKERRHDSIEYAGQDRRREWVLI